MTTTVYTIEAEDKKRGMTVGEVRAALDATLPPADARVVVRAGGRGQIKVLSIEVQP